MNRPISQPAAIDAVIFDVDGTLVDSVDAHATSWAETFRHFGHPVDIAAVRSQIGKGGDQLIPVFVPPEVADEQGEAMESFRADLFRRVWLPQVRGFADVPALFRRIRADGRRIALASSAKQSEMTAYRRAAGIEGLVDVEISSDDADRSKPHPDIFLAALERLELAPSRAVAVGDSPWDALAAGQAGLSTIGMLCGGFPRDTLTEAGCIALYDSPGDLLRRYDGSPITGDPQRAE